MMSKNDYVLSNLNMISRIALLENAKESRTYIDTLILILRYMDNEEPMSTLSKELSIIEHMFQLFRRRKKDAFNGIILSKALSATCYIKKGSLISLVQIALTKKLKINQEQLEIKVVTNVLDDCIEVILQDNGQVDLNIEDESLSDLYNEVSSGLKEQTMEVIYKKGVGTKVIITVPMIMR